MASGKQHYRIMFERNPVRYVINTTLQAFAADDFYKTNGKHVKPQWWDEHFSKNWEPSREWYNAYVTRVVQGPPNLDPSEHKIPSEAGELKRIERILSAGAGEMAVEQKRVIDSPLGYQRLMDHAAHKAQRVETHVWTSAAKELMGYDPKTAYPLPNPRFMVDPKKAVRLSVPDTLLENTVWHDVWGNHLIVARPQDQQLKDTVAVIKDSQTPLLLVGEATGIMRLAAQAVCTRLPAQSADVSAAVEVSKNAYATIGAKLGANPFLLSFEQLTPVHQASVVNNGTQHVVLPALEWAGLVDARAGGLPTPLLPRTGILVRDVGQNFKQGPLRLRRLQAGSETGDEFTGVIAKAVRIKADDIADMKDSDAWRYGKLSTSDLHSSWKRLFADLRVEPQDQMLWRIDLAAPVDKKTYTYINNAEMPIAMFTALPDAPARGKPFRRKAIMPKAGVAA